MTNTATAARTTYTFNWAPAQLDGREIAGVWHFRTPSLPELFGLVYIEDGQVFGESWRGCSRFADLHAAADAIEADLRHCFAPLAR